MKMKTMLTSDDDDETAMHCSNKPLTTTNICLPEEDGRSMMVMIMIMMTIMFKKLKNRMDL